MKLKLLCLVPWMAMTVVSTAQVRLADVHFTHFGPSETMGYRVADECYFPFKAVLDWGWKFELSGSNAVLRTEREYIEIPVRVIGGQETFPLRHALTKLGANSAWDEDINALKVISPIEEIVVEDTRVQIKSVLNVKPEVFFLSDPTRAVMDIHGARLTPDTKTYLNSKTRVGQYEEDIVRVVVQDPSIMQFPRAEFQPIARLEFDPTVTASKLLNLPAPPKSDPKVTDPSPETPEDTTAKPPQNSGDIGDMNLNWPMSGPIKMDLEGPTAVLLKVPLPSGIKISPAFHRPKPNVVEIALTGLNVPIPEDFAVNSESIQSVSTRVEAERTVLIVELKRPMGVELSTSPGAVSIQFLKPNVGDGKLAGKIVVVDPGHGGHDSGARSPNKDINEKDIVLSVCKLLSRDLAKEGATVIITRKTDVFVELKERAEIANRNKADLFLSVHVNSNRLNNSTSGSITFYHKQDAICQLLADCIEKEIAKVSKLPSIGTWSDQRIYDSGFSVLRNTTMPGVLIELGFINHNTDRKRVQEDEYQTSVSKAIVKGLKVYLGDE